MEQRSLYALAHLFLRSNFEHIIFHLHYFYHRITFSLTLFSAYIHPNYGETHTHTQTLHSPIVPFYTLVIKVHLKIILFKKIQAQCRWQQEEGLLVYISGYRSCYDLLIYLYFFFINDHLFIFSNICIW